MIFSRQILMNTGEYAEGYPLVFSSKRDKQARDWSITGQGVGDIGDDGLYHLDVVNKGQNLFELGDTNSYYNPNGWNLTFTDNSITSGVGSGGSAYVFNTLHNYPPGTYTMSHSDGSSWRALARCFSADGTQLSNSDISVSGGTYNSYYKGWYFGNAPATFIIPDIVAYWQFGLVFTGNGGDIRTYTDIQIVEGDIEKPYESYREPITTEVTLDEPIGVVRSEKNLATAYQVYKDAAEYGVVTVDNRNCVQFEDWTRARLSLTFKENTQYTVQFEFKNEVVHTEAQGGAVNVSSAVFAFFYSDGTYTPFIAAWLTEDWTHTTLTSTAGKTVVAVGVPSQSWCRRMYIDADTFQLEEGATATTYEPYYIPTEETVTYKSGVLPAMQISEGTNNITITGYEPSDNLFNVDEFVKLILAKDSTATVETIDDRRCIKFYNKNVYGIDLSTVCTFEPSTTYTLSADIKYISGTNETSSNALYFGFIYKGADTTNFPSYPSNIGVAYRTIVGTRTNAADWLSGSITSKTTTINALGLSFGNYAYWAIDLDSIMLSKGEATDYEPFCKVRNMSIKY